MIIQEGSRHLHVVINRTPTMYGGIPDEVRVIFQCHCVLPLYSNKYRMISKLKNRNCYHQSPPTPSKISYVPSTGYVSMESPASLRTKKKEKKSLQQPLIPFRWTYVLVSIVGMSGSNAKTLSTVQSDWRLTWKMLSRSIWSYPFYTPLLPLSERFECLLESSSFRLIIRWLEPANKTSTARIKTIDY